MGPGAAHGLPGDLWFGDTEVHVEASRALSSVKDS